MATSPSFVGTPRTQITGLTSVAYLLQVAFVAGVNGSVIKHFSVGGIADQQLYLTIMFSRGGHVQIHQTIPITAATIADAALGKAEPAMNLLAYLSGSNTDGFLELGEDESIILSLANNAGAAPDVGEAASVRIVGADY